jgi:hypothetical protein
MPSIPTSLDLTPLDMLVLRDFVRFSVLAFDQVARRYHGLGLAKRRLSILSDRDFIQPWEKDLIRGGRVYSATERGAKIARIGLHVATPKLDHLRHDLTVVDLADYLIEHEPGAAFRTEREVGRVLGTDSRRGRDFLRDPRHGNGHRPDGLLLVNGKCIAIELEHSQKSFDRYSRTCRWFAANPGIDSVRWYVDDDRTIELIRRANLENGFAEDLDVFYLPFPPGVVMRDWRALS